MCGIVGFTDQSKDKKQTIKKMADLIKHRGPDSEGLYTDDVVGLGFRRLSIIDLNNGDQPIYNEAQSKLIFFNGEIYNYQELREELEAKDHHFTTKADTEVVLHGYEEYGEEILPKLRGMFAFVIYDLETKELFGARDFFGIKPLYYYLSSKTFIFGSEIKSFMAHPLFEKELNKGMLERYLTYQYSVGDETFFKDVYKLRPGHFFRYKDNNLEIKKYFEIKFEEDKTKSLDDWVSGIKEVLEDSVASHKISDVEVGSFLSSGVDSSLIATMANVDKTFTVGFDDKKYSEVDYAKDLSSKIGVKNFSKIITKEEYFEKFPMIQYYMDEPLADASAIALYFVAQIASKEVKVALSGEGADEIFGGYNIYQEPYSYKWYYKLPYFLRRTFRTLALPFKNNRGFNFIIRRGTKLEERYVGNAFIFDDAEVKKVLSYKPYHHGFKELTKPYYDKVKDKDEVVKMQYIDFNFWLIGDILLKADKMSMANSLEVRVPYLDRVVVEYARFLPTIYKVDEKTTKLAFRKAASSYLEDKVSTKKKLGFPVPIRVWLKEDDIYEKVKLTFEEGSEFFNVKRIVKLLDEHKAGKRDNSRKIWTIYSFLTWYKQYFD